MADGEQFFGRPVRRVDGPAKVTGAAKYAAERGPDVVLHGHIVNAPIAKGRIKAIDTEAAAAIPGVVKIYTHANRPAGADEPEPYQDMVGPPNEPFRPLGSDRVLFSEQPIALVVGTSFEAARDAASLVRASFETEPHVTNLHEVTHRSYDPPKKRGAVAPPPPPRGRFEDGLRDSAARLDQHYSIAYEHHNPMEIYASTCVPDDAGGITVYDKTQGSMNVKQYLCHVFSLPEEKVRVINSFVGGAFGSGLRPQHSVFLATMAALDLKRAVRVELTRDQMFGLCHRALTLQNITLGAHAEGRLQALRHTAIGATSTYEDHHEVVVNWSGLLYPVPNCVFSYGVAKLDIVTPGDMRAPGAVLGVFSTESAIDELAAEMNIDPVELRRLNYAERDLNENKEFTSKSLDRCLATAAEAFGWSRRNPEPRSMRDGKELVGLGMCSGVWEAQISETAAEVSIGSDGGLTVASATADIGTGTYTVMTQTGADAFGLPLEKVEAQLGDSALPPAPVEGGSWAAASTCSAIEMACEALKKDLLKAAGALQDSPFAGKDLSGVTFTDGAIALKSDPARRLSLAALVAASGKPQLSATGKIAPDEEMLKKFSGYTHSGIFVEVRVDEELRVIRVPRVTIAIAAGKIINPKTARSQILGGVVMGLGSALTEESVYDHRLGRIMNHNLAEYHVPVNADIGEIDVIFIPEEDDKVSPIGVKGIGEIGIVGIGAAVANAVYHATGIRVRDLPVTIDKVMA